MSKFHQGEYKLKNPNKYVGNKLPTFRSSWELKIMIFFDEHPSIVLWGSEPFFINYHHPIKNKISKYYPDFIVKYVEKNGKTYSKVIEIKPSKETFIEAAKSKRDKLAILVNHAKWDAARRFCDANNMKFEILTELNLYKS